MTVLILTCEEDVTADMGLGTLASVSELFTLRMRGISPMYLPATASRKPSGAAYALHPESIASWMW